MQDSPQISRTDSTGHLIGRMWRDWMSAYKPRVAMAVALMIVVAAASAAYPKLIETSVDMLEAKNANVVWMMPLAIILVTFIKGIASYGQSVLSQSVALRVINAIQKAMFAHLMAADLQAHHETSTGKLISRFTNDVNLMRDALSRTLTAMARDFVTAAALIGMMFYLDWLLAIIVLVTFPLAGRPIIRIGRRLRRASSNAQTGMGDLTSNLEQAFSGIRLIKSYRMEEYERARANDLFDHIYYLVMKTVKGRARTYPFLETIGGSSVAAVLAYGGWRILSGTGTLGEFVGFLAAVILAYQPIRSLGNLNSALQEGLAAVQRSFDLLDSHARIVDAPNARDLVLKGGSVSFEKVTFAYARDKTALNAVDLRIPAGQSVALVGPSGAGKSTVMNLLLRFNDVDSGTVAIDGQDVRTLTMASLRDSIALVSQDITLFNDTVAANIRFGRPDATDAQVIAAARDAAAHDFVSALPDGYDTMVGNRGSSLSGGERQRIAIARAMLKDAPILLLDEATSALDAESEQQVQIALERLTANRTTLVVAHRLATVMNADQILVMDDGRVVETGTHGELQERDGLYARLSRLQFREPGAISTKDDGTAADAERAHG
ncbi:MAG: ABC transporter ATP-binding protein [Rhodospirillaceae bacterium]|jgi:subfamily B ATP-binding cassette protein MsbA|nr:ABC transporter ATP-binding protein [Rhodospirillaceae bacterium]MBT4772883.1 ABC transporter ATP-binding protein [Rhodospirillaceae bacterium]MBT5358248.1 ABC transporter ATP-binding protein [Rhodospirillaceae bacterium]MBT5767979.1 ABC transporter ATP-binding protein [Rhodospirillaceae bacterium]MBT6310300.1 ABC transporter ATP-binding protein [Rhodospirillaceae bacterium]